MESRLFGTPNTPGGQAQYVCVPRAGGTLYNVQEVLGPYSKKDGTAPKLTDSSLLLLCDILPTGVFAAFQALNHPKVLPMVTSRTYPHGFALPWKEAMHGMATLQPADANLMIAIIGLGPVGIVSSDLYIV